ncbi:MAG: amidase family protein, partial [Pseudomonadota bacterium]
AVAALESPPAKVSLDNKQSRIRFAGFIRVSKFMADDLAGANVSDHLAKLLIYGPRRSDEDWAEDQQILADTRGAVCRIIAEHGFLILPTVPNLPFAHDEPEPAAQADFTCLASIAGLPAISLPMGFTADGLPMGIQLVGDAGAEAGLFQLARRLDTKLGAYRAPQPVGETICE